MNTSALNDLLRKWRELTEAEGQAIVAENWPRVRDQQRQKEDLKLRISGAMETARRSSKTRHDEQQFRPIVAELISLETANAQLVAARRERTRGELAGFDRAAENLRGLNRAYGERTNACWTSYS